MRICVLLVVFLLIGALAYLNQIGLPQFLQRPLLQKLRDRGLDLELTNLRLHFYRGIVADNVKVGRMGDTTGARVSAREADLNLSLDALLRLQLSVSGVGLRGGRVIFPVTDTNQPGRALSVDQIRVDVRFQAGDEWSLEDFHAVFHGADFQLAGTITNATAVRDWPMFRGGRKGPGNFEKSLRRFADTLDRVHFASPPEMRATLSGDARDLDSFTLRLTVTAPDADTPWGKFKQGLLTAKLLPAAPIQQRHAEIQLQAASAETPWATVSRLVLGLQVRSVESNTNLIDAHIALKTDYASTRWAVATNVNLTARWIHSMTNPVPLSGHTELRADVANSRWANAKLFQLTLDLDTPTNLPPADPSWDWWQSIQPYNLGWSAHASRVNTLMLGVDDVDLGGNWSAPLLQITNLHMRFPDGELSARARLDVPSREVGFELKSDFDAHRITPLLTANATKWLAKYFWEKPPSVSGSGAITLPAWTNREPNWKDEVAPTLRFAAYLEATNCGYLKIPADWVHTHINYSNQIWNLPDLTAARPEGKLELQHIANDRTHEYWFGIRSTVAPEALRPLLSTNAQRGLDFFKFTESPTIEGGIWGRWRDVSSIGATGHVAIANFSFREQTIGRVETQLQYTNLVLELLSPHLERGTQSVTSAGITVDLNAQRVYFTNTISTAEPMVVARAIGPKTARAIEPYKFALPPHVRVNGYAPLKGERDADLRFEIDGGPFEWWKFHIPHISGGIQWLGQRLTLTNVQITAYDGTAAGTAGFNFAAHPGTDFYFTVAVMNADMRQLMSDVVTHTNNMEGRMNGDLTVAQANTENVFTWNGFGNVQIRDGLIWAIPVFGAFSKPLDNLAPGLGSTRIKEGAGQFIITNGVVFSDTLEMRSQTTRLQWNGTVDLEGHLNAKVAALPLRDAFGIGIILRVPLWPLSKLFEYRVSGSLGAPKIDPIYVPKMIMHPIQTFEGIFSNEGSKTNSPYIFKPEP